MRFWAQTAAGATSASVAGKEKGMKREKGGAGAAFGESQN